MGKYTVYDCHRNNFAIWSASPFGYAKKRSVPIGLSLPPNGNLHMQTMGRTGGRMLER